MSIKEKQDQLLPLFEKLTTLTRQQLPVDQRDPRLIGVGVLPRGTLFSCFHERHLKEATKLFEIFFSKSNFALFCLKDVKI
ncbi:unnamed protein product [Larinioides sclopetarius]|uniref:Uncharacterized protein n=1 Tax=Larinioides sclopetarius TaxID=280406 RepID=A0AAV1YQZ6_9ARAC